MKEVDEIKMLVINAYGYVLEIPVVYKINCYLKGMDDYDLVIKQCISII